MRVLPKAERHAMYCVYDFCRAVDDIADDVIRDRTARLLELEGWRSDVRQLFAGANPGRAAFLSQPIARFGLPLDAFEAIIDAMTTDVASDIRWPTAAELDHYCDGVASAVGRLSVRIFGMEPGPGLLLAHHLGRALQLTNILRDIDEDAAMGRGYLPREALAAAGIATSSIACVIKDPRIDAACHAIARMAEQHYAEADALICNRPRGHLMAPRLMSAAYASLLRRLVARTWAPPRRPLQHKRLALFWTVARLYVSR
jgi:phytoene synthase